MAIENGVELTLDRSEELMKDITALAKKQVMVGIPGTSTRSGQPISNATLGYIHEYGSPARNIPARPFLVPTVNRLAQRATAMLQQAIDFASNGKMEEANNQLEALGLMAANEVKKNIVAGGDPPFARLQQATINRKGSDKPLIDTGQLLNSITYVIRDRG